MLFLKDLNFFQNYPNLMLFQAPAILRPCTPLYAHVRPVRPQITPSTPSTPMGVHGRTLYAHKKFVRPHNCTPMGVHLYGRTNFLWVYNVRPCTPMKKNVYAHKKFTNKQNLVKDMQIPIKNHFFIYEKMHA